MTFNGNITVKQTGYSSLHIDKYDEDYRIPVFDAKVKGFLSGRLYPELSGTYSIVSSSGYVSELSFCGSGFFSGERNHFSASIYHTKNGPEKPIYRLDGEWSGEYAVYVTAKGCAIGTCDVNATKRAPALLKPLQNQDPWETRRAWAGVLEALKKGDLAAASVKKATLEEAQRRMRKREAAKGVTWKPLFFQTENPGLNRPNTKLVESAIKVEEPQGLWKADKKKIRTYKKPYHGLLTPSG